MQIESKNGIKKFRCYGRNRLYNATPEEEVRQELLKKLIDENKVPAKMLSVEKKISKYDDAKTNGRADIIIDYYDEKDDILKPLVIIECKRPNQPLSYSVMDQLKGYNDYLEVSILGMANGRKTLWYLIDKDGGEPKEVKKLPSYQEVIKILGFEYVEKTEYEIKEESYFKGTPELMKPFVANFYNLLNNETDTFPLLEGKGYQCLKDDKLSEEKNSNSSGGSWSGSYRFVLMNTGRTDNVRMSFCLFPGGFPYLACAFDGYTKNHNSLQLDLREWLQISKDKAEIWHNGRITVGSLGPAKNADVIAFVEKTYPELIVNEKIFLGELDNSKAFSFNNEDIKLFFSNLIKYILCREQFRVEFKRKKELLK